MGGPSQAELNREFGREIPMRSRGDGQGRGTLGLTAVIVAVQLLDKGDATAAGSQQDAKLPARGHVELLGGQAGILQSFPSGQDRQGHHAADVSELARLHRSRQVNVTDQAGDTAPQGRGVEFFDATDTATTVTVRDPEGLAVLAIGADDADAGHDNAANHDLTHTYSRFAGTRNLRKRQL